MDVKTISPSYVDQNVVWTIPTVDERWINAGEQTRSGMVDPAPPDPITNPNQVKVVRMVRQQPSILASTDAVDEARSTDDSPSQASSSIKSAGTTTTARRSNEVSSQLRQRIRQHAKQLVEQKRDSVQLAHRLQRSRSLQSSAAVGTTSTVSTLATDLEDDVQIDRRIEDSIQLGAKYTHDEHSRVWPESIQRRFFFDEAAEPLDDAKSDAASPAVAHTRPRFPTRQNAEAFRGSLVLGPTRPPIVGETPVGGLHDPLFDDVPTLFEAHPSRDVIAVLGHIGPQFLVNQGRDILGFENITTNRLFRLIREGDEDDFVAMCGGDATETELAEDVLEDLLAYRRPIDFKDQLSRQSQSLSRLDIDVNRVEFEHHWLYTAEDAAARALRTVFERYHAGVNKLMATVWTYVLSRQKMDGFDEGPESQLAPIVDQIDVLKAELTSLSQSIESAWQRLTRARSVASNQPLTRIVLRRSAEENAEMKSFLDGMDIPESLREILRLPSFALDEDAEATRPSSKVVEERMAMLKKCRLQIEIYFNGIHVCSTDDIPLTVDPAGGFSVRFGRVFRLQIAEPPREVCVRLRERVDVGMRTGWRELARVFVPLSHSAELKGTQAEIRRLSATSTNLANENSLLDVAEFASSIVHKRHKNYLGCGSGAPFLSGTVYYSANWFSQHPVDFNSELYDSHTVSKSPLNAEFSLIPNAMALCSEEEFQSEFGQKPAWRSASSGFTRQLSAKSRSGALVSEFLGIAGADDFGALTAAFGDDGELSLDTYRRVGHAYAVLIRRNLVESFALEHRLKTYSEIVHEESLPVLFRTFGTLFTPPDLSRKLKPMRLPTTAMRAQIIRGTYRLIVNLQSASNLAERISGGPCHVFVEVTFQKSRARTTVVEGHYANWQETITLELDTDACINVGQKPNTFEPRAVTDAIEIDIYDQIVTPFEMDDREPNTFHEQVENVWLGSARIPFPTVYSMGKVDGLVTLNRPLFTSGYKIPEPRRQASVKLLVAVDPPLSAPQFNSYESFNCGETVERLYMKAKKWETRLRAEFSDRRFIALANDSNGKRVLAQRFLSKITPPANIVTLAERNVHAAVSACVDFIASIPLTEDAVLFPGVCDVWTNAFEILKVGCGTAEEKAIFLTCILLGLNLNASLVLGSALPEGLRAAYVLVNFEPPPSVVANPTAVLINPTNANCYTLDDPTIPLSVGTVLTTQNTFGNVQRAKNPSLIDFDFKKAMLWQPLFAHGRNDLISVQTDVIRYVNASEYLLTDLRATLEREIKLNFDEARQYGIPQWNLLASRTLRDILQELWSNDMLTHEDAKLGTLYSFVRDKILKMRFNATIDVEQRLNSLKASYHVRASAFCCAYISKRHVIERVMKLRAHLHTHTPQIQHALAVHVHAFVNQLVTVSVAVAVLTPRSGPTFVPQSATPWTTIPFFPPHTRANITSN